MDDTSTSQTIDEVEELAQTSEAVEAVDETVEEVEDVVAAPAEAEPEETVEEEVENDTPQPSRRENLRIQQLIERMKQTPQTQSPQAQGLDYRTELNADDEIYQKLEQDRQSYGNNLYQEGIKRAESIQFHTRLEIDAPKIASKYKQLDQTSPEFNPAVANAINEWYLSTAGYDPKNDVVQNANVRYADFVEGIMEMADEIAGQKVQSATKNIAKQAATTGIRPDGSKTKRLNLDQAPQDMTDEELNAVISQMLPTK